MGVDPDRVVGALVGAGVRQLAGVPCSILEPLQTRAERGGAYLAAHVEGEAIALAAGAWLAGGMGGALLQNSGLGNIVNPLASLLLPYRIPAALVTSWRGEPGRPDAVHHAPMGAATLGVFQLFGLTPTVLREDADVERWAGELAASLPGRAVAAAVVPRGAIEAPREPRPICAAVESPTTPPPPVRFEGHDRPTRSEAIDAFREAFDDCAVVSTTGYTSRDLARPGPQDRHFYMQGSMGFALAVALGVARVQPRRLVAVLDGDGALMMRLGSLATAAALAPSGLVHVVLDNGTYGSTGGQPASGGRIDFARVALACGLRQAATCLGREGLADAMRWARAAAGRGPVLLHVRISALEAEASERPGRAPEEIADAFRAFLAQEPR